MPRKGTKPAAKVGRPSKYRAAYAEQAKKLCLLGATDADLADFFAVDERTIHAWKQAHPEFHAALVDAKAIADARVVQSLYRRALGYEHPAVKILTVADGNGAGSHVEEVPYTEKYPPDTTACIFWLKNRQKEHWRDKHEMEHGATETFASLVAQAFGTPDA